MINEKMRSLGANRSSIRELFEYGKKRKSKIGNESVFDFSIGNPSAPVPTAVTTELCRLLTVEDSVSLHGYTSAQGDESVRESIAAHLTKTYGTRQSSDYIYMTCGAAAALTIALNALVSIGEEVIVNAPYFPEYKVFIEKASGTVREIPTVAGSFLLDISALDAAINEKTAAILINSPNNPTGTLLTDENLRELSALLTRKQREYKKCIYLISDEPYRELIYDGKQYVAPSSFYDNTIVCYSFSKSLSLPGERIGYIAVSPDAEDAEAVYQAICGAGRALGFVCAPSMLQKMLPSILDATADISLYDKNRRLFYDKLSALGFEVVYPDGAFYLFVKSPSGDAKEFCERAKAQEILIVPSDDFGIKGYARISYCVATEVIERSFSAFTELAKSYNIC